MSQSWRVTAFTFPRKPVATCWKAFLAAFSSSLGARADWRSLKSWHIWGPMNTPALIFYTLCLGNFSHTNENAVPFLSSVYTEFFMRPNLIYRGGSNNVHGSTRGWWAMFFVLNVCNLYKGQFFLLWRTLLAWLSHTHRKQQNFA